MSYLEIEKAFEIAYENKLKYATAEYQSKIKELELQLEKATMSSATPIKPTNPFEECAKLEMESRIKALESEIAIVRAERDAMDGRRKTNLRNLDNATKQIANMREIVGERDKTIAELTETNNKLVATHAAAMAKLKGELAVEVKSHMSIKSKLEECERQREHIYNRRQHYADLYKTTKAELDKLKAAPNELKDQSTQYTQCQDHITSIRQVSKPTSVLI